MYVPAGPLMCLVPASITMNGTNRHATANDRSGKECARQPDIPDQTSRLIHAVEWRSALSLTRGIVDLFELDDFDAGLPQLVVAAGADRRRGQDDARRADSGGLLVQPGLAFEARPSDRSHPGGDLGEDVMVIVALDVELLADDDALLHADAEGLLELRRS